MNGVRVGWTNRTMSRQVLGISGGEQEKPQLGPRPKQAVPHAGDPLLFQQSLHRDHRSRGPRPDQFLGFTESHALRNWSTWFLTESRIP